MGWAQHSWGRGGGALRAERYNLFLDILSSHSGNSLLFASSFDVLEWPGFFANSNIDDLLFLTWLVAEQELADLEKWKQQNRAKPVYSVPQQLGKWRTESQRSQSGSLADPAFLICLPSYAKARLICLPSYAWRLVPWVHPQRWETPDTRHLNVPGGCCSWFSAKEQMHLPQLCENKVMA